jgi:hypothetical protein
VRARVLLLGLALCVDLSTSRLSAQTPPRQFDFAKTSIGGWSVRAETQIFWNNDQGKPLPRVKDINCYGQSRGADLSVNSAAVLDLRIRFLGPSEEDDDLAEIALLGDHLWLYIDGQRWEFAHIAQRPSELLNVSYPTYNREEEIIIPVWRGFQAVRKSANDPWANFDAIQSRLFSAKKLAWGFKSRDWATLSREDNELPKGWQNTRYPIDNTHWREVADWCTRQVGSEEARKLPADLLKHVEP